MFIIVSNRSDSNINLNQNTRSSAFLMLIETIIVHGMQLGHMRFVINSSLN